MQELNLRLGQGVALTYAQEDDNFKRLKAAIDALEIAIAGSSSGTVTSVGLTLPNIFTVTNSPVTASGSLTATFTSQAANRFFASPDGSAGTPTFRSLVSGDINFAIPVTKGGTGLSAIATANQVLSSNLAGLAYEGRTISVTGGLTVAFAANSIALGLNPAAINIYDFAGVLTANKGGTGISSVVANGELLIGNGTSWTKTVLTAGTGIAITNGVGSITISTSGVVTTAGGITNYIPKFNVSPNTVENSILYDTGARIGLNTITPSYEFDVFPLSGGGADSTLRVKTNTIGFRANLRLEDGGNTTTLSSLGILTSNATIIAQGGLRVYPSGNVQMMKGFAVDGFVYWNVAGPTYTFATNEQYGVVLGPASDNTMSVALPTSPMDGQEISILCEEAKTLTLTSAKVIYGHSGGVNIPVIITGGGGGAASLLVKYAAPANGGVGAWFITGL